MKEYTTCVVIASILLIWWVQPSKAQYGKPMAPINCKGNRCPGGEVTDPPDEDGNEEAQSGGNAEPPAPAPAQPPPPPPPPPESIEAEATTIAQAEVAPSPAAVEDGGEGSSGGDPEPAPAPDR